MDSGKTRIWVTTLGIVVVSIFSFFVVWNKTNRISKRQRLITRDLNAEISSLKNAIFTDKQAPSEVIISQGSLPPNLINLTCAQKLGIVEKVKTIHFNSEFPYYNPSIIEKEEGGYHLFFRHDEPKTSWKSAPFYSYIGYADLDENFEPKKIIDKLDTGSRFSEDPRVVTVGKDLFLSWNDKIKSTVYCRTIHSGKWNPKTYKFDYITNLDQHISLIEKNWVPFERWEKNTPHLGFVYAIQPHKILDVPHPERNEVMHLISKNSAALSKLSWNKRWGKLGGGTTARLIRGEYLSFFHSSFREYNGVVWYVMGAYTFEATPPHRITSITRCPILFPGIYSSKFLNTADSSKRIIYPAGIALETKEGKTLLHVSCGENDSAIKIITIDYSTLKKNMISVLDEQKHSN